MAIVANASANFLARFVTFEPFFWLGQEIMVFKSCQNQASIFYWGFYAY